MSNEKIPTGPYYASERQRERKKQEKTKEIEEESRDHAPYPTSYIEQRAVTFLSSPIAHV